MILTLSASQKIIIPCTACVHTCFLWYFKEGHVFLRRVDGVFIYSEFEELAPKSNNGHGSPGLVQINGREANELNFPGQNAHTRFFEVGCGVGNTVFPVLQANSDGGIFVYCCDFAQSAVDLVKQHPDYDNKRCHAFLCDVAAENPQFPFPKESLDVIVLIFVLSAIAPNKMQRVINNLSELLKPGGKILFRDYGRFDMAQLRFKKGRCLEENFYVRGDGTRVYFFTQVLPPLFILLKLDRSSDNDFFVVITLDELSSMFKTAGLIEEQNHVDRRLQGYQSPSTCPGASEPFYLPRGAGALLLAQGTGALLPAQGH
eukprot:gene13916-4868_t